MKKKKTVKVKKVRAWADVGSSGGIYVFEVGPVASRYPRLMHVYYEKVSEDLIPVEITYKV